MSLRIPRPRFTYANVMASGAMFVALGGTSYAVAKLPKNSVGGTQIKAGAVSGSKIAAGAVTADKLGPGIGATGARGPRGGEGPTGPSGASDGYYAKSPGGPLASTVNTRTTYVRLALPAGSYLLHASATFNGFGVDQFIGTCAIRVNGDDVASSQVVAGSSAGSSRAAAAAPIGATTMPAAFTVALDCFADAGFASPPSVGQPTLTATRVDRLH